MLRFLALLIVGLFVVGTWFLAVIGNNRGFNEITRHFYEVPLSLGQVSDETKFTFPAGTLLGRAERWNGPPDHSFFASVHIPVTGMPRFLHSPGLDLDLVNESDPEHVSLAISNANGYACRGSNWNLKLVKGPRLGQADTRNSHVQLLAGQPKAGIVTVYMWGILGDWDWPPSH